MRRLLFFAAAASAWAQLNRPAIGHMLDSSGFLRPVFGVAGNFTVDGPVLKGVLSMACSGSFCLAKTESAILSPAGEIPAPPGNAQFALDGDGAMVYFPSTRQFSRWRDGVLSMLDLSIDGEVLSLRAAASGLEVAVRRDGHVRVESAAGALLDSLPDGAGPVLLLPDLIVFVAANGDLAVRRTDATELRFAAAGVEALFAMGAGYLEARAGDTVYALRTGAGREQLFVLPRAAAQPARKPR